MRSVALVMLLTACSSSTTGAFGGGKPGDECRFVTDCAPDARGFVACAGRQGETSRPEGMPGICVLRIEGAKGDGPCVATKDADGLSFVSSYTASVTTGYYCDKAKNLGCDDGNSQTCIDLVGVGAPREDDDLCVATAYCGIGKCEPRHEVGEGCISTRQCVEGARCDEYGSRKCEALLEDGAICAYNYVCLSRHCSNGKCGG